MALFIWLLHKFWYYINLKQFQFLPDIKNFTVIFFGLTY